MVLPSQLADPFGGLLQHLLSCLFLMEVKFGLSCLKQQHRRTRCFYFLFYRIMNEATPSPGPQRRERPGPSTAHRDASRELHWGHSLVGDPRTFHHKAGSGDASRRAGDPPSGLPPWGSCKVHRWALVPHRTPAALHGVRDPAP